MIQIATIALLGMLAGAQQPQVDVQELPKPGQTQTAQPGQPAKPEQPKTDAKQQTQPSDQTPKAVPPAQQPAPQATPAPQPSPVGGQHVPAPEERERGLQGKPVGAFWTVIPGK